MDGHRGTKEPECAATNEGDGLPTQLGLRVIYPAGGSFYCKAAALWDLRLHPRPVQPLLSTVQEGLAGSWSLPQEGGVVCKLEEVAGLVCTGQGIAEVVVRLGNGVDKCVHDCVKDDHRERVSLENTHLHWRRLGGPLFGANNSNQTSVQVRDSCYHAGRSMVVFQGETDELVVHTPKSIR